MGKETNWLSKLKELGGYYECRKTDEGHRLDPLVGYAGRDTLGRQYVGEIYANFAVIENIPRVLAEVAQELLGLGPDLGAATGFCGAPEGGKALAVMLGYFTHKRYIFPEKKVRRVATPTSREVAELVFGRHQPATGEVWWTVEDVCNNFSTTADLIKLIESFGASVGGIICFLNRSLEVETTFVSDSNDSFPVVALVRKPFGQFMQDDPIVQSDVSAGNVVWKPKDDWARLEESQKD